MEEVNFGVLKHAYCATPNVNDWGIDGSRTMSDVDSAGYNTLGPGQGSILTKHWALRAGIDEWCSAKPWREVGYTNPHTAGNGTLSSPHVSITDNSSFTGGSPKSDYPLL